jgi:hypothetical protein
MSGQCQETQDFFVARDGRSAPEVHMKYPTQSLMLAALLCAPAAQATAILIYKTPESLHDLRTELTVDPARRTVGAEIRINQYPGDAYSRLNLITKVIPALTYDPLTKEIRYRDIVCAEVEEHSFLITHWHFVNPTEHCSFEERRQEVVKSDVGSPPMTEVYFVIDDGG